MVNGSDPVLIDRVTTSSIMALDSFNLSLLNSSVNGTFPATLNDNMWHLVMGVAIFFLIYPQLYFVISFLPLGPLAASLLGATLMVLCQLLSEEELYVILSNRHISSAIICVAAAMLFGLYAMRLGFINAILKRTLKPSSLTLSYLWRVSLLSFLSSGLFSVDTTSTVIVPNVLKLWKDQDRPFIELETLLLALSTSANLGSVLSVWGSIHMALLAVKTSARFPHGSAHVYHCGLYLIPAALLAWTVNVVFLMVHYLIRKRLLYRLASASPSSRGQAETPTSSRITDISVIYIGDKKKSNGYVNTATVNSPTKDSELVLLTDSGIDSTSSKPYTLETINEDEELQIIHPTPLRHRPHDVIKSAPVASGDLLEDLEDEEESEFEKGERLAAEELNDLEISSPYRPLVPGRDTPSASANNDEPSSGNLGSMRKKFQPLDELNLVASDSTETNDVDPTVNSGGDLGSMRKKFSAALDLNSLTNDPDESAASLGSSKNYKPGLLSSFSGGDPSDNDQQLLFSERHSNNNTPSNGSVRRHSTESADSKQLRRFKAAKYLASSLLSYGLPVGNSSGPLLYWSPTNVSMAELLFDRDCAVPQTSDCTSSGRRCVCFTVIYVACYVAMVTFSVASSFSSAINVDMGVVTLATLVAMVVLLTADALVNQQDVQNVLSRQLNWSVLLLFVCLTVWLAGFIKTGVVTWLWHHFTSFRDDLELTTQGQLTLTVILISSVAYMLGAPIATLLLLGVAEFNGGLEFVLLLAWCGAVVGNLTPSASSTPLLAAHATAGFVNRRPSYCAQLAFTLPTTLVVLTLGVVVIHCLVVLI